MVDERKLLAFWSGHRSEPPTLRAGLAQHARVFALRVPIIAVALALCFIPDLRPVGLLAVGFVVGSVGRDIEWIRHSVRGWPVTARYLDWGKVDAALAGSLESREESDASSS
jgi:hypothetical protein